MTNLRLTGTGLSKGRQAAVLALMLAVFGVWVLAAFLGLVMVERIRGHAPTGMHLAVQAVLPLGGIISVLRWNYVLTKWLVDKDGAPIGDAELVSSRISRLILAEMLIPVMHFAYIGLLAL